MKTQFTKLCGIFSLILCSLFFMFHAWANEDVVASVEYFYANDGTLIGKSFNGKRMNFEYDLRGQLLAVKDASGKDLERYTYDLTGNRLSKMVNGVTTTYTYDKANQLMTSTENGKTTHYKYDAAGRLIQAGDKVFRYGDMNKVVEISRNGCVIAQFEYFMDGQLASAKYGDKVEEFLWDGLSLIQRNGKDYVNEPYVTGGNPVIAGDDVLFNDMLGSTLAVNGKPVEMTVFGETSNLEVFFTGKPMIPELGYSFLFRDYDPAQGKWTTTDPLGYPDGWNNLAYCNNKISEALDSTGREIVAQGGAVFNSFVNSVVNTVIQSQTIAGQNIRKLSVDPGGGFLHKDGTVVREYSGGNFSYWPGTTKDSLLGRGANVTLGMYTYQRDGISHNHVFALLHELLHAFDINIRGQEPLPGGDANREREIDQQVTELLNDSKIKRTIDSILLQYPSKGTIRYGQGIVE